MKVRCLMEYGYILETSHRGCCEHLHRKGGCQPGSPLQRLPATGRLPGRARARGPSAASRHRPCRCTAFFCIFILIIYSQKGQESTGKCRFFDVFSEKRGPETTGSVFCRKKHGISVHFTVFSRNPLEKTLFPCYIKTSFFLWPHRNSDVFPRRP